MNQEEMMEFHRLLSIVKQHYGGNSDAFNTVIVKGEEGEELVLLERYLLSRGYKDTIRVTDEPNTVYLSGWNLIEQDIWFD